MKYQIKINNENKTHIVSKSNESHITHIHTQNYTETAKQLHNILFCHFFRALYEKADNTVVDNVNQ